MEQELWNLLFRWITGKRCFIPEGCPPPAAGVVVYAAIVFAAAAAILLYVKRDRVRKRVRSWRS